MKILSRRADTTENVLGIESSTVPDSDSGAPRPHRVATRKLCAGVYVDHAFRDRAMREIYDDRQRRVAPSYGFDLIPVLIHARHAFSIAVLHDTLLLATVVAAVCYAPVAVLFIAGALTLCYATVSFGAMVWGYVHYLRERQTFSQLQQLHARRRVIFWVAPPAVLVTAGAGLAMVIGFPQGVWPLMGDWRASLSILLVFVAAAALHTACRQVLLRQVRSRPEGAGPDQPRNVRLAEIDRQQRHPFTVHANFTPFVGSGRIVREWSFAQRLVKAKKLIAEQEEEEFEVRPFSTRELVRRLETLIESLAAEEDEETQIAGLDVTHRIFVAGVNAWEYRDDLETTPSPQRFEEIMRRSSALGRHYLTCQVESWQGEIVTTVYVHVSLQGRMLYLQFCACALPPTPREYQFIEETAGVGVRGFLTATVERLLDLPELLQGPRRLCSVPRRIARELLDQHGGADAPRRGRDVGAVASLRERQEDDELEEFLRFLNASPEADGSYFQLADVRKHIKIIERQLIAGVTAFLKEKEVDTGEFTARTTAILNQGVINTGDGTVNAQQSVMGSQNTVNRGSAEDGD
ncbi:hypothetical protein [Nonomuraea sp. NPDC050643]|uniref:hypothetical protein n=1 Tax=Nonomuraea sp. NPDC050643 TaxID=3155660 RepID=UPI0033D5323C